VASLYLRGSTYWLSYRLAGHTCRLSLMTKDKQKAKLLKSQYEIKIAHGDIALPLQKTSADAALEKYLEYLSLKSSQKHVRNREIILKMFLRETGVPVLASITNDVVNKFLTWRKEEGCKDKRYKKRGGCAAWTLKNNLAAIKAWLAWCVDNNYLSAMPLRKVFTPRTETKPPDFLSKEEARTLLAVDEQPMQTMIAIALYTGIRQGELMRLKWEDFNLDKNTLMIRKAKSGEFRAVPFNPALKPYLEALKQPSGELFKDSHRFPVRAWNKTRKMAKIKVKWHNLRHTYASHLIIAGAPIRVVSELMGHADISTTMIYSHLLDKHKADAAKLLNF
jgi:integrase